MKNAKSKTFTLFNRTISVILCCVMCLIMFPSYTLAEGETTVSVSTELELLNAVTNAGTTPTIIDVTDDITFLALLFMGVPINIPNGADITIRASGKDVVLSKAADSSAIFNVASGGKLTLSSVDDNKLTIDGEAIISSVSSIVVSGTLITNNVDFSNNTISTGNGGAISCVGTNASCTINGGLFKNNIGMVSGGAIAIENAELIIDGATFDGNTVSNPAGNGGAVYCKTSSVDFKNSSFVNNSAMVGGAVEFTTACTGEIGNCTFKNNSAVGIMGKGGALDFDNCYTVKILSGVFENNRSSTWGGAIYTDGIRSDFFMDTVLFEDNNASIVGGAIWHCPLGTAHYYTYSGMMFWNNSATNAGADMYLSTAKPGLENGGEYVSDKTYSGSLFDWCYDVQTSRYDPENPAHILDNSYYQGSNVEVAMKSNITESEYLLSKDAATIIFRGNFSSEGGALANNGFVEVGYKSGLTIEKRVTGDNAPADDAFDFTVEFSDGNTYDGIESGSTVTLKNGERKLISNVPQSVVATVTESKKANYTAVQASQSSAIGEYGSELIFVNHYTAPTGNLSVLKTVTGNDADKTKSFGFTVTLSDALINGIYGGMNFTNGVATFRLKDGESQTATGLPVGITYTVGEEDSGEYTVTKTNDTGTIAANTTLTATFNNHKDSTDTSNKISVSVEKIWQDNNDNNRPSSVTVQLYKDGIAFGETVVLNDDDIWKAKWDELDGRSEWTVDEVNVPEGYTKTVSCMNNNWIITNKLTSAKASNPSLPQTGDTRNIALWIALLFISGGAVTVLGITRKCKKAK